MLPCTEKEQGEGEAGEETEGRRGAKKVKKRKKERRRKRGEGVKIGEEEVWDRRGRVRGEKRMRMEREKVKITGRDDER